jgi:hypothetical protein
MARTRLLALSATIAQIAFGCAPPPADSAHPATCEDIRTSSMNSTGRAPADGIYTIYLLGDDPDGALDVYCQDMRRADPPEYLPVDPAHNFAWLKSGDETLRA